MMLCLNDYTLAKPLICPNRVDDPQNLVIGTLAINTDYTVYLYREETDILKLVSATTNGAGLLTVNLPEYGPNFVRPFNVYYLLVTLPGANLDDRENIQISAVNYTLFKLEFQRLQEFDATDEVNYDIPTLTQTIEPTI